MNRQNPGTSPVTKRAAADRHGTIKRLLGTSALVMAASIAAPAYGQQRTWNGSSDGAWTNGANWNGGTAPTNDGTQDVLIDTALPNAPTLTSLAGVRDITIGGAGQAALDVGTVNGFLRARNVTIGRDAGSEGTVRLSSGGRIGFDSGSLVVGDSGRGTLLLNSSSSVSAGGASSLIVARNFGAVGTVTNNASSINVREIVVGEGGFGTLNVASQGSVSSLNMIVGKQGGGFLIVRDTNSTVNVGGLLTVGDGAFGAARFSDGAVFTGVNVRLGVQAGVTGNFFLERGSTWTSTGLTEIGVLGNSSLIVSGGSQVQATTVEVAKGAGSTGAINLSDAGFNYTDLSIGNGGNGSLIAGDPAAMTVLTGTAAGHTLLGTAATGGATVEMNGTTVWRMGTGADALLAGNASLSLTEGAGITVGGATLGSQDLSVTALTIDGPNAGWEGSGALVIGDRGTANVSILNGSAMSAETIRLGAQAGGTGNVVVRGVGSTLSTNNPTVVVVGDLGRGSLTIDEGATGSMTYLEIGGQFGGQPGGVGAVTVRGSGTSFDAIVTVGVFGQGSFTLDQGASLTSMSFAIGANTGSVGTATFDGTNTAADIRLLSVGSSGSGSLFVTGGATLRTAATTSIGIVGPAGVQSKATISGAGSSWDTTGLDIAVGANATGELDILNGGRVKVNDLVFGLNAGAVGTGLLSGANSLLTAGNVRVGAAGNGTLTIERRARALVTGLSIGDRSGGVGSMLVTGAGTILVGAGSAVIGGTGDGNLTVSRGASVTFSGNVGLGNLVGSNGTLSVDGAGSRMTGNNIVIGTLGSAAVYLSRGGQLASATDVFLGLASEREQVVIGADNGLPAIAPGYLQVGGVLQFGTGGELNFNHNDPDYQFDAAFASVAPGAGLINHFAGVTHLAGDGSAFRGEVDVTGGTLFVDDRLGSGGTVSVTGSGRLGGVGIINSPVMIGPGGTLVGVQGETLTMTSLFLDPTAHIDALFDRPGGPALFDVGGLTLDGTIDISGTPAFGPGVYRIFDYGGALVNNGLDIGTVPDGTSVADFSIQTAVANQINLVSTAAVQLHFWDGDAAGNANNNRVDGGSGTWTANSTNFTDFSGATNGSQSPQPGFVVFQTTGGNVLVSNAAGAVSITGAQFANDGYRLDGDAITLAGTSAILRVGDGTPAGMLWTARIGAALTGTAGIEKTDRGILLLSGTNTYTGLTTISSGILALGGSGSIAASSGVVDNDVFDISQTTSGASITTLSGTGAVGLGSLSARTLTLTQASGTFAGNLAGIGNFTVAAGSETLSGVNSLLGAIRIDGGATLALSGAGSIASASGVRADGTFDISAAGAAVSVTGLTGNGAVVLGTNTLALAGPGQFDGVISGAGGLAAASGTTFLGGANTYTGGTSIASGTTLVLGSPSGNGTGGSIPGDVVDDGSLVFARGDDVTFGGTISGSGFVQQGGTGTVRLTGPNSYLGLTVATRGTLIGSAANFGQGDFQVLGTGTLVFDQSANATLARLINGNGQLVKAGAGTLTLTGISGFSGTTTVTGGELVVAGELPGATNVATGGALSGGGLVGDVSIANGGVLNGTQGTTLTSSALNLSSGAVINASFTAANGTALFATGDLVLDGTVNVTFGAGPGVYRLIDYSGTLTDNELIVGNSGAFAGFVQTSVAGQVNLVGGTNLTFWDAGGPGNAANNRIDGGSGTWTTTSPTFTDPGGQFNGPQTPQPGFVVFQAAPGTVTIDNGPGQVGVTGMQFASDGYVLTGGALSLSGPVSVIRVGDGTMAGGDFRATIASPLTGTAQLQKLDLGTLVLTGANTYSGGTTISGGTLQLGAGGTSGSIAGDVVDNGAFAINRSDAFTFAGIVSGTGSFIQGGTGITTLSGVNSYAGGTLVSAGTLIGTTTSFGSGAITDNATLVFDQPGNATYAGAIGGTGALVKRGAGTLILAGVSGLTGGTTIASGRLSVNGSLSNSRVTVQSGATLGGTGTVGGVNLQSGGVVAPGNSIGVLSVAGNYVQAAGSIYRVELTSAGAADRINVTGTASLAPGAVLDVVKTDAASYVIGTRYSVLTTTGGVTGTYTLTGDVAPLTYFVGLRASYDGTNVYLDVARVRTFAETGGTFNQTQTGLGLDSLTGGTLVSRLLALPDEAGVRGALDQLSGEIHASARTTMLEDSRLLRDVIIERARHTDRGEDTQLWGQVIGSWAANEGDGNAATLDHSTAGLVLGLDASPTPGVRVGMLGAYTRADLNVPARRSTGSVDSYSVGLYAQGAAGPVRAKLGAAYSWQTIRTRRAVDFAGFSDELRAGYHGSTAQAFADLSYRIGDDNTFVEPFAQAAYISSANAAFDERGGAAALTGADRDSALGAFTLGARVNASHMAGSRYVVLRGSAGWRTVSGELTPAASLAFDGGSAFTITGAPIAKNALVLDAGLDVTLNSRLSLNLNYTGQIAGHSHDNAVRGGVSFRF